jgi:hypothetical protein
MLEMKRTFQGPLTLLYMCHSFPTRRRRRRRAHDASQEMCGQLAGLVCVSVCFEFVMLDLLFFLSFYICPPNRTDGFPLFSREIDPLDLFF